MIGGYRMEVLESFPRITLIHHVGPDGTLWATRNRTLLRRSPGKNWEKVGAFPFQVPKDFLTATRLTARASRTDKCNVHVNSAGNLLGIRGSTVYHLSPEEGPVPLLEIRGDSVLHRGICEDGEGWVYFGEYFQNKTRGPVRIFRATEELDDYETAYQFHAGSIRHVHGLHRDPFDPEAIWVTVGDYQGECFFFRTRNRFLGLEKFGDGTQTWRAVGLMFTPTHVCWITDSHLETNHACRMERATGRLEIGQRIDCSSWYCAQTVEGLYVAFTTVEKGPAIHRDESSVLVSEDGFNWGEAATFNKDFWRPMSVFKYGVLTCPSGRLSNNEFYLSGEGLSGLDGCSLKVAFKKR